MSCLRKTAEKEAVLFARSATAGGQKFPVHWGGDCSANYPSMAETLRGGLSFAMSGFSFWSHDISGFESTATPDLYKRWCAFGLMSTHSRLHGSQSYRVPWLFDEEACDVVKFFTNLKCRLMPYIYQKSVEAHEEGIPVMRPMVFEYPQDPAARYLDQQYMLGESLLVAPVLREDHVAEYYLPEGTWTDLLTHETKEGGRWYQGTYDYFSMPLYVKENSILVWGHEEERPDYDYSQAPTVRIYQPKEGEVMTAKIPDINGAVVCTIEAVRKDGKIQISVDGQHGDMKIEILEGTGKKEAVLKATETALSVG